MTPEQLKDFVQYLEACKDASALPYGDEGDGYDFDQMAEMLMEKYVVSPKNVQHKDLYVSAMGWWRCFSCGKKDDSGSLPTDYTCV